MTDLNEQGLSPDKQDKPPRNTEIPAGMSKEEWEKMNITWAALEALNSPPSERAQHAAGGDKVLESIFQMTEGIVKAGERMGMQADEIESTIGKVFKPEATTAQQTPVPATSTKQG